MIPSNNETNLTSSPKLDQAVIAVLGSQWGDEGKGKLVDILAADTDICCRFNGGANAGHTLVVNNVKYALHLAPCGVLYPHTMNLLGHGTVIHLKTLLDELEDVEKTVSNARERIFISNRAHLLFDFHLKTDSYQEEKKIKEGAAIGTTRRGIGPCYATKMARSGLRVGDLLNWPIFEKKYRALAAESTGRFGFTHDEDEELERHKKYLEIFYSNIIDGVEWIHRMIRNGKRILIEGANAALLDIDFGTYPCVTSSTTTVGGISTGLGIPPNMIGDVVGVVKAYTTRVGEGPFPTELNDNVGKHLREVGHEYGTTTGRPRRCGWLDAALLRYSSAICGFTKINLTKLDVLTGLPKLKICISYRHKISNTILPPVALPTRLEEYDEYEPIYETCEGWTESLTQCKRFSDLPVNAQNYVKRLEELLHCPVVWIGVGCQRDEMVLL